MSDLENLENLILAPYILKATALISVKRQVGGNQFRHAFSTLGILLDYKQYHNSVLLKASLLHDLLEDLPETQVDEIRCIDQEGPQVVELVLEVTRKVGETKADYLKSILYTGSQNALLLKCADRISNLTDLHRGIQRRQKITSYLNQTVEFVLPMARIVSKDMEIELIDLITRRREIISRVDFEKLKRVNPFQKKRRQ